MNDIKFACVFAKVFVLLNPDWFRVNDAKVINMGEEIYKGSSDLRELINFRSKLLMNWFVLRDKGYVKN